MNGRLRIYRGERPSRSALRLGRAIRARVLLANGSRFRPRSTDTIINWGATEVPDWAGARRVQWLNSPTAVAVAVDKRTGLRELHASGVPTIEFTLDIVEAQQWADAGEVVVVRSLTRGSGGRGIGLVGRDIRDGDHTGVVPRAPLYTKYFKGTDEYRIHVVGENAFDQQMKRLRRTDDGDNETRVRNLANGWVFCRDGVHAPQVAVDAAIASIRSLKLDFGAVDLKCNRQRTRCAVLEVNTAPGLEGTTLANYAVALRGHLA